MHALPDPDYVTVHRGGEALAVHREDLDALLAPPGRPRSARLRVPGGSVAAVRTSDGSVYLGLTQPVLPATWIYSVQPRPTPS